MGLINIIAAISGGSGGGSSTPSGIDFAGKIAVGKGDSVMMGAGATTEAERWFTLFCQGVGATEDNDGVSGMVFTQNFSTCGPGNIFDFSTIPTYSSSYAALFIAFGANDIKNFMVTLATPETWEDSLNDCIDYAVATKGWPVGNIVLVTPYYATNKGSYAGGSFPCNVDSADIQESRYEDYAQKCIDVAGAKNCVVGDIYTALRNHSNPPSLYADGLHPNDAGHAFIADFFINLDYTPQ